MFGTVLLLPDTPMLPPLTPGCTGSLHPDVKDGNMGVFTEIMCLSLLKKRGLLWNEEPYFANFNTYWHSFLHLFIRLFYMLFQSKRRQYIGFQS